MVEGSRSSNHRRTPCVKEETEYTCDGTRIIEKRKKNKRKKHTPSVAEGHGHQAEVTEDDHQTLCSLGALQ